MICLIQSSGKSLVSTDAPPFMEIVLQKLYVLNYLLKRISDISSEKF